MKQINMYLFVFLIICFIIPKASSQVNIDSFSFTKGMKMIGLGINGGYGSGEYVGNFSSIEFCPNYSYFIFNKTSLTFSFNTVNQRGQNPDGTFCNINLYLFSPSIRYFLTKKNKFFLDAAFYTGNNYRNNDSVAVFSQIRAVGVGCGFHTIFKKHFGNLNNKLGLEVFMKKVYSVNGVDFIEMLVPFSMDFKINIVYHFK